MQASIACCTGHDSIRAVLGAFSALALICVTSGAVAQVPPPDASVAPEQNDEVNERAREHYQRGVQFYRTGDDKLALVEFRRAYDLSKNYRILFNIGRVNQQLNQYADALAVLERYLLEGGEDVPPDRRLQVQSELNELRHKTAQVAIVVNVQGAEVRIDGVPVGTSPTQGPVRVDVGDHHVEARRSGYRSAGKVVTVAGRDIARISLELHKSKPVVVRERARPAPRPKATSASTTPLWIGWISTGAFVAGAGVMGGLAASRANDLEALRDSPTSSASDRETVADQAHKYAVAADVLTAAAVVAGGTSLYLSVTHGDSSREVATTTRAGLCGTSMCVTHQFY